MENKTSLCDLSQFTNKYSLSKTLRFELKPIGNTPDLLRENNIFQIDENRKKAYEKTRIFFDKLHKEFINEALNNRELQGLNEYAEVFKKYRSDKKNIHIQKSIDNKRKNIKEEIVKYFNQTGKNWTEEKYAHLKMKKKDTEILFEEAIFEVLKEKYGTEKDTLIKDNNNDISIFDVWNGFLGYFGKFFETRKNFYKVDGTIATRLVDQNLDRFLENIIIFDSIKDKLDLSEVERDFNLKANNIFQINFYNTCLLQDGIDKYNEFLGGKVLENGEKKKGINEIINKYRQDNKDQKIPFLKKLDKQILSEGKKFIDEIETDEKLFEVLTLFLDANQRKIELVKKLFDNFFNNTTDYNLRGIFISKEAFNTISYKWTNQTDIFTIKLYEELKSQKLVSSSAKKKDGTYIFPDFISLSCIQASLRSIKLETKFWKDKYYEKNILDNDQIDLWIEFLKIFEYEIGSLYENHIINQDTNRNEIIGYNFYKKNFKTLLNDFKLNVDTKITIKDFVDSVLHIYQMAKYFALEKKRSWVGDSYELDPSFYNHVEFGFKDKFYDNAYEDIVQIYNKIRNYLTKKPYSQEKWKLNFGHAKLLQGFTESKTEKSNNGTQYGGYILRKKNTDYSYNYFIGVSKNSQLMSYFSKDNGEYSEYERLNYYQIKIDSIYGTSYEGNYQEDKNDLTEQEIIIKIKNSLKGYISRVKQVQSLIDKPYTSIKNLQNDIENLINKFGKTFEYKKVTIEQLNSAHACKQGFYLFKIYSKDFSKYKSKDSIDNLHSMYLKSLLNGNQNIFDLGSGEIFFRPSTQNLPKEKIITNKGVEIIKNSSEIIHKRRYTEPKIFLHLAISLNQNCENPRKGFSYMFNQRINNELLANNPDINIIGVDRGEKHLAYYSVINQKGERLDFGSLNSVNKINYHEMLGKKADHRDQSRKNWLKIEGIKDLKKGYISQVVRKLADLAIKHNAIIVMEDLNMRFKQIRGGIEKSIYQQLEKALIEKLNFLVNKGEKNPKHAGHVLNAYQLTAPFETFKDMGKQTGIIFYTQAAYTSKIDPVTGWRPNLYLKYSNAENAKRDIMKFINIQFIHNRYEFTYDLKTFQPKQKEYPNITSWTVCSNVERFRWNKNLNNNKDDYRHYKNLTENINNLFVEFGISNKENIKDQIKNIDEKKKENAKFFRDLIHYFTLICQIRNTQQNKEGNENDFLLSPVEPFFDSRRSKDFGENLPENGDDNGAYNIARKGIVILKKISEFVDMRKSTETMKWDDLYISHKDWDNYITQAES